MAAPTPVDTMVPTTPKSTPTPAPTASFAAITRRRIGSASSVGVRVWCRYSDVTSSAPTISGNTYPSDTAIV